LIKFLKAALSFFHLEARALSFYPVNGLLRVIQSFVGVGIWFFLSLFLKDYAAPSLTEYGGDYTAYMIIGVLFFQNTGTMLGLTMESLNKAYWERRLEVYHSRPYGVGAYIAGRFIWQFTYNTLIICAILITAILSEQVTINPNIPYGAVFAFYIVFTLTCFGIGLAGAGNFFFLEIKQGREPVIWTTDILARIFSGVYYPLSVIPVFLQPLSKLIPHTYALKGIRMVMINGTNLTDAATGQSFMILCIFCILSLSSGILIFRKALSRADRTNGIGIPV
jgi:ABC-2 type transport system permease protein